MINWKFENQSLSNWEQQEMWVGHYHEIHLKCSFGWLIQTQYYIMVQKKSMLVEWWSLIARFSHSWLQFRSYNIFFSKSHQFKSCFEKNPLFMLLGLFVFVKWWNFVTIKNANIIVIQNEKGSIIPIYHRYTQGSLTSIFFKTFLLKIILNKNNFNERKIL